MNIEEFPPELRFLFTCLGQCCVKAYEVGMDEKDFLKFSKAVWETMELNGAGKFRKIIEAIMANDINDTLGDGFAEQLRDKILERK